MSSGHDDDGFAPMDDGEHVAPLGPSSRQRAAGARKSGGCLKGCLITLAVLAVIAVISVYACGKVVERSISEDPAEVLRVATEIGTFALPPGYQPEGSLQIPVLGKVAIFTRAIDAGEGAAVIAVGRVDVELDPKELMEVMGQASGQGARDAEVQTRPCQVAGRPGLCLEATSKAQDSDVRVRWKGLLLPVGASTSVAAVFDEEARFDAAQAQAFLDSFAPR
jgi:hypothetical protein